MTGYAIAMISSWSSTALCCYLWPHERSIYVACGVGGTFVFVIGSAANMIH
jgi:hypothetical protein